MSTTDIELSWWWGYQSKWGSYFVKPYHGADGMREINEARRSPSASTVIRSFQAATEEEAEKELRRAIAAIGVDTGKEPPKPIRTFSVVEPFTPPRPTMSKDHLEVISANQSERIERIKTYHAECRSAFGHQMGMAFLCGLELTQAKAEVPHGQFTEWRNRYLPDIADRTATQYMAFVEGLKSKSATVADLTSKPLQLTNGALPEKQKEQVLKAVHEAADGKSLTQLYRDLGLIRQPTPAGGYRPDLKALKKFLEDKHPTLVGTKWPDLPKDVQDQFKKEHKPKIDPKLVAESKRQKADAVLSDLGVMLTEQEFKKYWTPDQRKFAKDLLWDFHQKLTALDKTKPKAAK